GRGLAAAEGEGLVERDIKPGNVLLEEGTGRVKITDFGLAFAGDELSLSNPNVLAGTPQFMSPEQAMAGQVDARSDLFSLGSVLFAMCTGQSPFRADSTIATLQLVTNSPHSAVREINPDVPPALEAIIDRLLAKSPQRRFQSAAEVAEALSALLTPPAQPPAQLQSWTWLKWVATVLLLLVCELGLTEAAGLTSVFSAFIQG